MTLVYQPFHNPRKLVSVNPIQQINVIFDASKRAREDILAAEQDYPDGVPKWKRAKILADVAEEVFKDEAETKAPSPPFAAAKKAAENITDMEMEEFKVEEGTFTKGVGHDTKSIYIPPSVSKPKHYTTFGPHNRKYHLQFKRKFYKSRKSYSPWPYDDAFMYL